MKTSNPKKSIKTIYFTDIKDDELVNILDDNYQIFDRKKIISHRKGINRDVFNYFNNRNLEQEFMCMLKNKKISNVVYRLYYNDADKILSNIKNIVIPKIKNYKNMVIMFKYLAHGDNYEPNEITPSLYDGVMILDK